MRIRFRPTHFAALVAAFALSPLSAHAQTDSGVAASSPSGESASAQANVAPPDTREVVAEGRAAIGEGGVVAARKMAIAQALRSAVEMTTGVYVSAHTLTRNYQMVRDQVVTHADGFATPEEVVRETVGTQEVRVTVRALVSLRPLAERLKALNLTRVWRVHVTVANMNDGTAEAIGTALEKTLADAGLVVVSSDDAADVVVRATRRFEPVSTRRERQSDGTPHLLENLRGVLTLRATLAGTGEVVAALTADEMASADASAVGGANAARADAMTLASATLAPRLTDALMLLPAREAQPVQLVVGKIGSAARAGRFEDALNTLPGITSVTRRRYEDGNGIYELQVLSDAQAEIARDLEESPALKSFKLTVLSDTLVKIVAATNGVAPVFSSAAPAIASASVNSVVATAIRSYAPSAATHNAARIVTRAQTKINPIDGAEMIWIAAGAFVMGDNDPAIRDNATGARNNPRHTVYLGGYYISKDLVTVGQYRRFCAATGHAMPTPPLWGWHDDHPIVGVTWDDARAYCAWAGVRLPTESEWEKAARGPNGQLYPWGNDFDPVRLAYRSHPTDADDAHGTDAIDRHPDGASPYGVEDMAGNVWEWCADLYEPAYLTAVAPPPHMGRIAAARRRVLRGGSWFDASPADFRSAFRSKSDPSRRSDNIGFRTVSEPW